MGDQARGDAILNTTVAGRYEVFAKLGEGGMGAVYAAKQSPLNRTVALKVLLKQLSQDPIAVKRFEKEALAISRLAHPNTVTIFDFGTTEQGLMYIAMEFLEGRTLREVVEQEAPLSARRVVRILAQIVRALSEAHLRGVIHRDLKPDNIMLVPTAGEPDFVKVLDFGVAKLRAPEGIDVKTLTQGDVIFGTPRYMSPEQVNGVMDDPRSDLYAVGAIAYEMLSGRPVFDGDSAMTILIAHVQQAPSRFAALPRPVEVPEPLEQLVMRLLAKDRNDRFADADALLRALDELPVIGGGLRGPSGRTQGMLRPILTPDGGVPKVGTEVMGSNFAPAREPAENGAAEDAPAALDGDTKTLSHEPLPLAGAASRGPGEATETALAPPARSGPAADATPSDDGLDAFVRPPGRSPLVTLLVVLVVLAGLAGAAVLLFGGDGPPPAADRSAGQARLEISSRPAGARIFIDGAPAGTAPLQPQLATGRSYRLRAELAGHQPQQRVLGLDSDTAIQFVLEPVADAGAAADAGAVAAPDPEHQPTPEPGKVPVRDPGKDPGRDPGKDPGRDPGKDPGRDPGEDPGKDPVPQPEQQPVPDPAADPGKDPNFELFDDFKEM